jgi:hypothetical protein
MKTFEEQVLELLTKYDDLKDELLDYTDEFHDSMLYDIQGYREEVYEDAIGEDELVTLKKQVKAFELILKGYKGIKYIYG